MGTDQGDRLGDRAAHRDHRGCLREIVSPRYLTSLLVYHNYDNILLN